MIILRNVNWFDNDFQSSRQQFLGSDAESFVWNGDDLPVDVLFSTLVTTAPVDVALAVSLDGPVGSLTLFRAVGPLLATTTQFCGQSTNIEAVGAVPNDAITFLRKQKANMKINNSKTIMLTDNIFTLVFTSVSIPNSDWWFFE